MESSATENKEEQIERLRKIVRKAQDRMDRALQLKDFRAYFRARDEREDALKELIELLGERP